MPVAAARKPLNLVYGVDENPPIAVTVASALQHVSLISIFLLFPLLVCREAQLSADGTLEPREVSTRVNRVANDDPACLEAASGEEVRRRPSAPP